MNVETLCWSCAHAVPSADGERGCSWSLRWEPVVGWEAVRRDIKIPGKKREQDCITESYLVVSCPRYQQG